MFEDDNKRLNNQKDCIIQQLTKTIDTITSELSIQKEQFNMMENKLTELEEQLKLSKGAEKEATLNHKKLLNYLKKKGLTNVIDSFNEFIKTGKDSLVGNKTKTGNIKKKAEPISKDEVVYSTGTKQISSGDRLTSSFSEALSKVELAGVIKTDSNKEVSNDEEVSNKIDGYTYDWETRSFWLDNTNKKETHIKEIQSLDRAASLGSNADIANYSIELYNDSKDKDINEQFIKIYMSDIINNGYVLTDGILNTSKLLMLNDEESRIEVSKILRIEPKESSRNIINLAMFYDKNVRRFEVKELVNRYGLSEASITESLDSMLILFKAKQFDWYVKYLSIEDICWIESSLNKHTLCEKPITFAKLHTKYMQGYSIDELFTMMNIKEQKEDFVKYLTKFKAYEAITNETLKFFKKDCWNESLTESDISSLYKVPLIMCRHMKNMYKRYINIIK